MASWFSEATMETLSNLKNKVQASVAIDPNLIQKLTLQSPELAAERTRIDNEERRKESVRDSLAEILPWETRDAEMAILVDECKEIILALSASEETFTGPFVLSGGLQVCSEDDDEDELEELSEIRKVARDKFEAEKSAEKLSKLQPLPTLLRDFDLDTHVGLIQRLFRVDPKLVMMHSRLSSGGEREITFWKNYFFHCAYARFEAGLSIDEIWSIEPAISESPLRDEESSDILNNAGQSDEEIIFSVSSTSVETTNVPQRNCASFKETSPLSQQKKNACSKEAYECHQRDVLTSAAPVEDSTGASDYEFVPYTCVDEGREQDELEAEIAAALGD